MHHRHFSLILIFGPFLILGSDVCFSSGLLSGLCEFGRDLDLPRASFKDCGGDGEFDERFIGLSLPTIPCVVLPQLMDLTGSGVSLAPGTGNSVVPDVCWNFSSGLASNGRIEPSGSVFSTLFDWAVSADVVTSKGTVTVDGTLSVESSTLGVTDPTMVGSGTSLSNIS